jgi:hypothetical protein
MARPKKWSGETTAIRVPAHLAEKLIEIAQRLDTPQPGFVQNSDLHLVTVDGTRYILPPVAVTAQEDRRLNEMVDKLLLTCKGEKLDPLIVLAQMTPYVCEAFNY